MELDLKNHPLNIYYTTKNTAIHFSPCNFTIFLKTDLKDIYFLMSMYFTQRPSVKIHLAI